jgi:hypothetical protein
VGSGPQRKNTSRLKANFHVFDSDDPGDLIIGRLIDERKTDSRGAGTLHARQDGLRSEWVRGLPSSYELFEELPAAAFLSMSSSSESL